MLRAREKIRKSGRALVGDMTSHRRAAGDPARVQTFEPAAAIGGGTSRGETPCSSKVKRRGEGERAASSDRRSKAGGPREQSAITLIELSVMALD